MEKKRQMKTGVRELEKFYQTKGREELRLRKDSVQYLEFLTAAKYLEKYLPPASRVLDNCAGSGIYAFHLADMGHTVTAGDLIPYNVQTIAAKNQYRASLAEIFCGDALNLTQFADASFDAVLCMGALYHLHEQEKRKQAMAESLRLLAPGGIFFCTYMSRFGVVLQNTQGDLANVKDLINFIHNGRKGIFYASTPAEMENLLASTGFTKLCHLALDGIVTLLHQTGRIDEDGLEAWAEYHFASCEEPSILGYSCHNMLIAQKK